MDILQTVGLSIKSYRWAIIGPPFLRMPRSLSRHVIATKESVAQESPTRCPCWHYDACVVLDGNPLVKEYISHLYITR